MQEIEPVETPWPWKLSACLACHTWIKTRKPLKSHKLSPSLSLYTRLFYKFVMWLLWLLALLIYNGFLSLMVLANSLRSFSRRLCLLCLFGMFAVSVSLIDSIFFFFRYIPFSMSSFILCRIIFLAHSLRVLSCLSALWDSVFIRFNSKALEWRADF